MKLDFRGFRFGQRQIITSGRADTSRLTCRAGRTELCGTPATWMLTAGCRHEHIVPSLACDEHTQMARDMEGRIICTPCNTGDQPHACPVMIEFTALNGKLRSAGGAGE
jgi:hypothetical protein